MQQNKKNIYFASDFHLGLDFNESSKTRELKIVSWLQSIEESCLELFLVGDIFDYWFEYKKAVPKGYVRLLGQLARMADKGIIIHLFIGNHDMWQTNYFVDEIGVRLYKNPQSFELGGKTFYIGHGDGLGPGDVKYKIIKKFIRSPFLQFCYSLIHPNLGLKIMKYFSQKNRKSQYDNALEDISKEWLVTFAENKLQDNDIDYFVFGHRHIAIDYTLSNKKSKYINLGDWLDFCTYAVFDGTELVLNYYEDVCNKQIYKG